MEQFGYSNKPRLLVLVNDWQYLNWPTLSRRESERKAAHLRAAYYDSLAGLPEYHESELKSHELGHDSIFRAPDGMLVFAESSLRQRLSATIAKLIKNTGGEGRLGLRCEFDEHGELLVGAETTDCTSMSLLQSGRTNCAGEVIELLNQLHQRGVRTFINLYPAQCREPVEAGTDLAERLLGLSGMTINNIAIPCSDLDM